MRTTAYKTLEGLATQQASLVNEQNDMVKRLEARLELEKTTLDIQRDELTSLMSALDALAAAGLVNVEKGHLDD